MNVKKIFLEAILDAINKMSIKDLMETLRKFVPYSYFGGITHYNPSNKKSLSYYKPKIIPVSNEDEGETHYRKNNNKNPTKDDKKELSLAEKLIKKTKEWNKISFEEEQLEQRKERTDKLKKQKEYTKKQIISLIKEEKDLNKLKETLDSIKNYLEKLEKNKDDKEESKRLGLISKVLSKQIKIIDKPQAQLVQ